MAPPPTPTIVLDTPTPYPVTILAAGPAVTPVQPALAGLPVHIDIHFNKPMNQTAVPTVIATFADGASKVLKTPGTWSSDQQTYSLDTDSQFIQLSEAKTPSAGGKFTLQISGAIDGQHSLNSKDGGIMDADPRTIAYLDASKEVHGLERGADHYHAVSIATLSPTPTATPKDSPTDTPTPLAPTQVPSPITNVPAGLLIQPSVRSELVNHYEKDGAGGIYWCGTDGKTPARSYLAHWDIRSEQSSFALLGLYQTSSPNLFDVSPNGRAAVAELAKIQFQSQELFSAILDLVDGLTVHGTSFPAEPQTSTFINSLAFDRTGNLYLVIDKIMPNGSSVGTGTNTIDYLVTQFTNGSSSSVSLAQNATVNRDPQWDVSLRYSDGTTQILAAAPAPREDWRMALLEGLGRLLGPERAWADESNFLQGVDPALWVDTGDGRVYVLSTDGSTIYGYDTAGHPLCQLSIKLGANDPFMGNVLSFKPTGGPGGTLVSVDGQGNARFAGIPMPPGFTPQPTATPTSTSSPTFTWTPTFSPSPTVTDTPTATNENGYTSTFTPTDSPTLTDIPSDTPVLSLTSTPSDTPSGDAYGSWLQAGDSAGFGQRAHHAALFFNNKQWVIGGLHFDSPSNDVWSSTDGKDWTKATTAGFTPREDFGAVVFNNALWVAGGGASGSLRPADIWYSGDGIQWVKAVPNAPWGPRDGFSLTVWNGQMWLVGGRGSGNFLNDVWTSPDGFQWTRVTANADFSPRDLHQTIVAGGRLWVMGGEELDGGNLYLLSDVWSTSDGTHWEQATDGASWSPRDAFMAGVDPSSGEMVVLGGEGADGSGNSLALNDIYHSADGIQWTASTYSAPFQPRASAGLVSDGSRLWVTGGDPLTIRKGDVNNGTITSDLLRDVWYSNIQGAPTFTPTWTPTPDGNGQWVLANGMAPFIPRSGAALAEFSPSSGTWAGQDRLWLVGGTNSDIGPLGDVWSSRDGVNWDLSTDDTPFDEQTGLACADFNGRLWAFNVIDWETGKSKVWATDDGSDWEPTSVDDLPVDRVFPLNGRLYALKGSQVSSSNDGSHWSPAGAIPPALCNTVGYAGVVFGSELWILGGQCFATDWPNPLNGIYRSADGAHWTEVSAGNMPLTLSQDGYQAVSFGGTMYLVGGGPVQDQWSTSDGIHWRSSTDRTPFSPRGGFSLAAFNGRMWVIGGQDSTGTTLGDVWAAPMSGFTPVPTDTEQPPTSTWTVTPTPTFTPTPSPTWTPTPTPGGITGLNWFRPAQGTAFTERSSHSSVVLNGRLWVLAGQSALGGYLGDIWNSVDGSQWNLSTPQAPFGPRWGQAGVVFDPTTGSGTDGKLWVIGGWTSQGVTHDVWSSADGVNWTRATSSAPFSARAFHQALVFNGQLWVLGGEDASNNFFGDVWATSDGVNWQAMPAAAFGPRASHQAVVFDAGAGPQIWVFGGSTKVQVSGGFRNEDLNDIWTSTDGLQWTRVLAQAPFDMRTGFTVAAADGRLWVTGGRGEDGALNNDVWYSCDGAHWSKETEHAGFSPRQGASALVFNNGLWILGGLDNGGGQSGSFNGEGWYSPIGDPPACIVKAPTQTPTPTPGFYAQWNEATSNAGFQPRAAQAAVVFDPATGSGQSGRMWILGGGDDNRFYNDVWSSPDGITWSSETAQAPWNPRIDHGAVVYDGKIWVVGGQNLDDSLNGDVWCSSDGVSWVQATSSAPFGPRTGLSLFAYDAGQGPRLWVAGGLDGNDNALDDLWSSADGIDWEQVSSGSFTARTYQAGVSFKGRLWLADGVLQDGSLAADAWQSSADGMNWTRRQPQPVLPTRQDPAGTVFDGRLFLSGGTGGDGDPLGDVWYTPDGTTWNISNNAAAFGPRSDHSSLVLNNRLWVLAGWDGNRYHNDVWYAESLSPYTPTPTITPTPTDRPTPDLTPPPALDCPVSLAISVGGPEAVGVDGRGFIYVAESDHGRVDVFDPAGEPVTQLGGSGTPAGPIDGYGVAVDGQGRVFVTDNSRNRVDIFNPGGQFAYSFGTTGSGQGQMEGPAGITIGANGPVYVADNGNRRVDIFDLSGGYLGQVGFGDLSGPVGVGLDGAGNLYVSDANLSAVFVFNSQGGLIRQWPVNGGLFNANFLAVDQTAGLVYVSDGAGNIGVFGLDGTILGIEQVPNSNDTEGLAVVNGGWFEADSDTNTVYRFQPCMSNGQALGGTPTASTSMTFTPTGTPSPSPTNSPTWTASPTPSDTPTDTATDSMTATPSRTASPTPTATSSSTDSPTETPTDSPTDTDTWTPSFTATHTPTWTATGTPTATASDSPTWTATWTPTDSPTDSMTATPSRTASPTPTATPTDTASQTSTRTATASPTLTVTYSPTASRTGTPTDTPTQTKTPTPTLTRTKTPTPTRTNSPTATPTPLLVCVGTLSNPKLDLQVSCFQRDSQQERLHTRITNYGTSPVTLGNLSVKMWVNESQLVNMGQWVQLGQICNANGSGCVNVNNTGFSVSAGWLSSPCTVDGTHKANQVAIFAAEGNTQSIPPNGGYWDGGYDLGIGRNNPFMDDDWADDYSKTSSCPGGLVEDSHFALYYNGVLLQEWSNSSTQDAHTGGEPCCGDGGAHPSLVRLGNPGAGTPVDRATGTPTPVREEGMVRSCLAAPSVSRGGQPIRFRVDLGNTSRLHLTILAITGETVRQIQAQGNQGENSLDWDLRNDQGGTVASGLYLYYLEMDNGPANEIHSGKLAVIR
ncbi:MAG TPA: hypothetical protein VHE12_00075 [bacterium]|nr:hypothetical protein [bacterium]